LSSAVGFIHKVVFPTPGGFPRIYITHQLQSCTHTYTLGLTQPATGYMVYGHGMLLPGKLPFFIAAAALSGGSRSLQAPSDPGHASGRRTEGLGNLAKGMFDPGHASGRRTEGLGNLAKGMFDPGHASGRRTEGLGNLAKGMFDPGHASGRNARCGKPLIPWARKRPKEKALGSLTQWVPPPSPDVAQM
jgi:hypothetical protein